MVRVALSLGLVTVTMGSDVEITCSALDQR